MRKITIIIASILLMTNVLMAQQAFQKGDFMLSPGMGIGTYGTGAYGVGFAVPAVLNVDYGVHDFVSVGLYGGFWTKKHGYLFSDDFRFSSYHVGGRGSFHWWQLLDSKVNADLISDKLDIYATFWMGYNIRSAKYVGIPGVSSSLVWKNRFQIGGQLGVRYFFTENIGVYGEWGGTPTSYANVGLTVKF